MFIMLPAFNYFTAKHVTYGVVFSQQDCLCRLTLLPSLTKYDHFFIRLFIIFYILCTLKR